MEQQEIEDRLRHLENLIEQKYEELKYDVISLMAKNHPELCPHPHYSTYGYNTSQNLRYLKCSICGHEKMVKEDDYKYGRY